ncbi:hypothetical protein RUM44_008211 [Polyplax serrata]|uniref:Ribosomal RNA-processing protein 8 n=1 Tax=Polyplax serrata TaxID=468196 RepID=A0ABR1BBN5_POLSC
MSKIKKSKSTKRHKKEAKARNLKKKKEKLKKAQKKKLKSVKGKTEDKTNIKKSSFSYSLKKYQNLPLRDKMLEKLKSSRFRFINEQLYTMKGKDAFKLFQDDADAFVAYHEGYSKQMKSWPKKPVDIIIETLKKLTEANNNLAIGDFGCGDAKIATTLTNVTVHSFDLASLNPSVTICDMTKTPLENETLDIAVFCLSLMGTNFSEYLVEANRVLKTNGKLIVAEVQSRFDNVEKFMEILIKFGFKLVSKDFSCRFFYIMNFKKEKNIGKNALKKLPNLSLKPCFYKKR